MDLDKLFGDGAELGDDLIVKAQLRFRVHPPQHPVAQDIVDRIISAYDERLDIICREVDEVLQHADVRRSERVEILYITPDFGKVSKSQVYAPGAKGGKWYRDGQGHIRYGEQPNATFKQKASTGHTGHHIGHYRPSPFMGMNGVDRDLTGYIAQNGGKYGFNPNETRFLAAWYGTGDQSGALFDAFLDCAGLTRDDLSTDISQLRFGGQKLTYEEAVFEFFAAQQTLFMGDEKEDEEGNDWETILNDQIRPLLDTVFSKYENLKEDESFMASYAENGDSQRERFFANARRSAAAMKDLANEIVSAWNPSKQVSEVLAGMKKLGLFTSGAASDAKARVHDRPHLNGHLALDDRLLVDDAKSNPLIVSGDKLAKLAASQLMCLYAAAELHRRWDPETRSYSQEKQEDTGAGALGHAVLEGISGKSKHWKEAVPLVRVHLDVLVDRLVKVLNGSNKRLQAPKVKNAKP